jgi:hypothetical protein
MIPLLRGEQDSTALQLGERIEGAPGCAPSAERSKTAAAAPAPLGRNIELIVGGDAAAQRLRQWVPQSRSKP